MKDTQGESSRKSGRTLSSFRSLALEYGLSVEESTSKSPDAIAYRRDNADAEPKQELDLHGLRVKEALVEVDSVLNRATLTGLASVTIVHGKGSGTLRQAVRDHLEGHPMVDSWSPDYSGESTSDGALIVKIASG